MSLSHSASLRFFFLLLACRAVAMRRRVILLVERAIGVNCPYLRAPYERDQRN